jgi:hypothetical protein
MAAVERRHEVEQNVFRKQSSGSSLAMLASCHVVHLLAKKAFATHSTRISSQNKPCLILKKLSLTTWN